MTTGRLLTAAARVRGSALLLCGMWAVTLLLLLPGVATAELVLALVRRWQLRRIYRLRTVECPRGHTVVVRGRDVAWECEACHFTSVGGSAFSPCRRCSSTCGSVSCACGASVRNPAFDLVDAKP